MANEKQRQLMQEALDDILSPQEREALMNSLAHDQQTEAEYQRLQKVDELLRVAPHERAPKRLALNIMARLSQTLKEEALKKVNTALDPQIQEELLNMAMALTSTATMPLMVGASWLIIHAKASPELLDNVFQQIIATMLLMIEVLEIFLDKAQEVSQDDPEMAMALFAMMPDTLFNLVHYVLEDDDESE